MGKRWMKMLSVFFLSVLLPLQVLAIKAIQSPVLLRQADGKQVRLLVYGDEFFHYTTDENGYLVSQKSDGNYYYSSIQKNASIKVSDHPYGSVQKMMHRRQIPREAFDLANERREQLALPGRSSLLRVGESGPAILKHESPRQLVLLVDFKDCGFKSATANTDFSNLLNASNYLTGGATGSARAYFYENSMQTFNPSFDVYGPLVLEKDMADYGGNDSNGNDKDIYGFAKDALMAASAAGVDFSLYDNDGDGVVESFFIFYAGFSEAEGGDADCIWPHSSSVAHLGLNLNGLKFDSYACGSELRKSTGTMSGIGTFCHEYAHVLGLPDFYDIDYESSGGSSVTLSSLSLMDGGSYNNAGRTPPYMNAEERSILGWLQPTLLVTAGDFSLQPISQNQAYRINTENKDEYFLIEYRNKTAWDAYIGETGAVIYHVDKSQNMVYGAPAYMWWQAHAVNVYPSHRCMYAVDASGLGSATVTDFFYTGKDGRSAFATETNPRAVSWAMVPLPLGLYDINPVDDNTLTFRTKFENETVNLGGVVSDRDGQLLQNAVVQLSKMEETLSRSGLRMAKAAREETYYAETNKEGQYSFFSLPGEGKYLLTCQKSGYMQAGYEPYLQKGGNVRRISLFTQEEQFYREYLRWYDVTTSGIRSIGAGGEPFTIAARWEADEVSAVVNDYLGKVTLSLSTGQPDLEVFVWMDDSLELAKRNIQVASSGLQEISFIEDSIRFQVGHSYLVGVSVSNYSETSYPIVIDNGPGVRGKGDLIYDESSWIPLSEATEGSIDANWAMTVISYEHKEQIPVETVDIISDSIMLRTGGSCYLQSKIMPSDATFRTAVWRSGDESVVTVSQDAYVTARKPGMTYVYMATEDHKKIDSCKVLVSSSVSSSLRAVSSQHQVLLSWEEGLEDSWKVLYRASKDSVYSDSILLDEPLLCVESLQENSSYQFKMIAYQQGEATDSSLRMVKTQSKISDFPGLYILKSYEENVPFMLDVNDLSTKYDHLLWRIDGEEQSVPWVRSLPAGEHWLEAEIHYPGESGVETIKRKIQVKAKK